MRWMLVVIYFSYFGMGLPNAMLGAAWPSIHDSIGVPNSYLGILSMIVMGCTVIASASIGVLTKRFSMGAILIVCALLYALPVLGFGLSGVFVLFCILSIPLGLAIGAENPLLNNYVAVNLSARHMNWGNCFWGIGATLGPIVISFGMTQFGSWSFGYYVIGGFLLIVTFYIAITRPKWKAASEMESHAQPGKPTKISYKELFYLRGMTLSLLSFFCYVAIETTISMWGSSYMVMVKGASPELAAQRIAFFFFGMTFGRIAAGFFASRISNQLMVRIGYIILTCGIIVEMLSAGELLYIGGFLLMGIGCAPIFPSLVKETPNRFGKERSQSVVGLQVAFAYIGSASMPPLFGAIAYRINYELFSAFLGILICVFIAAVEILNRRFRAESEISKAMRL